MDVTFGSQIAARIRLKVCYRYLTLANLKRRGKREGKEGDRACTDIGSQIVRKYILETPVIPLEVELFANHLSVIIKFDFQ